MRLLLILLALTLSGCDPKSKLLALQGSYTGTYQEGAYLSAFHATLSATTLSGRDRLDIAGGDSDLIPFTGEIDFKDDVLVPELHVDFYNGYVDEVVTLTGDCYVGKVTRLCVVGDGLTLILSDGALPERIELKRL